MEGAPRPTQRPIEINTIEARITIARSWKSLTIPLDLLKAKLSWIMLKEGLTTILRGKMPRYEKTWDPWNANLMGTTSSGS